MTIDIRTPEEKAYDDLMSGAVYAKPIPLSAQEEEIIELLLALSEPDPEELGSGGDDEAYDQLLTSVVTSIGQILCESDEPATGTDVTAELIADLEAIERHYLPACPNCGCPFMPSARYCDECERPIPSANPSAQLTSLLDWMEKESTAELHTGDELPFGQLADGTPITGVYDKDEPGGRSGIVHAEVGDWLLTAQDEPNLLTMGGRLEDMTIDDINRLRAFLATDIPEQLLAAAVAHSRGDAPPAPPAPASAVAPGDGDDEVWIYRCGTSAVCRDHDCPNGVGITVFGCLGFEPEEVESGLPDLIALMADPRVQALRRGEVIGLERKAA